MPTSPSAGRSPPTWRRCAGSSGTSMQSPRSADPRRCSPIWRATPRVAISNRRLIAFNEDGVTFRYKDYRADGRARYKRMTLATQEFIRRFLIHVLPKGFHRIRHYGLFARPSCADNIARARELLAVPMPQDHNADADAVNPNEPATPSHPCPCCGGRMITIEIVARGSTPHHRPTGPINAIRIDTS